jgi:hypothetical protein
MGHMHVHIITSYAHSSHFDIAMAKGIAAAAAAAAAHKGDLPSTCSA